MTTALSIITDAYERMNRLSPGETLSADDAEFGFRRLNSLVDELSAKKQFLFRSMLTSVAQSGNITLGAGPWAAVAPGDTIVSATADNLALARITMQQYNELYQPNVTGRPTVYAQDGLNTIYLWPAPTNNVIKLQTNDTISAFADQETQYTMPSGYASALGAALAVRVSAAVLGGVPAYLVSAEKACMAAIDGYEPMILNVGSYTRSRSYYPPRLF